MKEHRGLAQTPWVINGKRIADSSVSELVAIPLLRYIYPSLNFDDPCLHQSHPRPTPSNGGPEVGAQSSASDPATSLPNTDSDMEPAQKKQRVDENLNTHGKGKGTECPICAVVSLAPLKICNAFPAFGVQVSRSEH